MGSSQKPSLKKRFYQVKIKSLEGTGLRKLGQLMGQLQRQAFRKAYGKIWDLARVEVSMEPIASLSQYYDQPLRCFTFEDFQLVPTVKEFEEILGCPLGGRKPYLFSGFYPSTTRVAKVVKISAQELDRVKQNRNGVVGVPRKCLEERAKALANQGEWAFFYWHLGAFDLWSCPLSEYGRVSGPSSDWRFPRLSSWQGKPGRRHFGHVWHVRPGMWKEQRKNCLLCTGSLCVAGFTPFFSKKVGPSIRYKVTARASKKERRIGTNSWLAWRGVC